MGKTNNNASVNGESKNTEDVKSKDALENKATSTSSKSEEAEVTKKVLTQEDLDQNPELATKGLKVGDEIEIPTAKIAGSDKKSSAQSKGSKKSKPKADSKTKKEEKPAVKTAYPKFDSSRIGLDKKAQKNEKAEDTNKAEEKEVVAEKSAAELKEEKISAFKARLGSRCSFAEVERFANEFFGEELSSVKKNGKAGKIPGRISATVVWKKTKIEVDCL